MKLVIHKCQKAMEPDFWKKISLARYRAKIGPKWVKNGFFGHNSKIYHLIFLIFCMKLMNDMTDDLTHYPSSGKISMGGKSCSKWAKIAFFVIYHYLCIICFWFFVERQIITWFCWPLNFSDHFVLLRDQIMPKMSKNVVFEALVRVASFDFSIFL